MLLKFTTADMLNTQLVDHHSGDIVYTIESFATYSPGKGSNGLDMLTRTTFITNAEGHAIARMEWAGVEKRHVGAIQLMDGDTLKVADLFAGCQSVKRTPRFLRVPSRLDYDWVATREAILVMHPETEDVIGKYYERCILVGHRPVRTHIPGVGANYLDFKSLPDTIIGELLVDYILINIMRRTRFNLAPYDFSEPISKLEKRKDVAIGAVTTSSKLAIFGKRIRRTTL